MGGWALLDPFPGHALYMYATLPSLPTLLCASLNVLALTPTT